MKSFSCALFAAQITAIKLQDVNVDNGNFLGDWWGNSSDHVDAMISVP
jgi:hypothetical protein